MSTSYHDILNVWVWADYTGGVARVLLKEPGGSSEELCKGGFWIDDTSGKNANVLSTLMSAYHTGTKVKIYANENQDWSGLASEQCKIQLVVLEPR